MKTKNALLAIVSTLMIAGSAIAQVPSGAPAGTTGLCKDGSYWSGSSKKGACRGHKGVQTWYAASEDAEPATQSTMAAPAPRAAASSSMTPSSAPAGSTGLCKDGSYWSGASKKGACRGHKGLQTWYAASSGDSAPTATTPAPTSAPMAAPAATTTTAPMTTPKSTTHASTSMGAAAPGGGAGQVWVNTPTKVYHCPSDRYYGKTKSGSYMTEQAAIAAGDHAAYGKACH